jgi:hypothetical protein
MYSVFMSYGPGIRIIYPRNAVKYMRDKMKEAFELYDEVPDAGEASDTL